MLQGMGSACPPFASDRLLLLCYKQPIRVRLALWTMSALVMNDLTVIKRKQTGIGSVQTQAAKASSRKLVTVAWRLAGRGQPERARD